MTPEREAKAREYLDRLNRENLGWRGAEYMLCDALHEIDALRAQLTERDKRIAELNTVMNCAITVEWFEDNPR